MKMFSFSLSDARNHLLAFFRVCLLLIQLRLDLHAHEAVSWSVDSTLQRISVGVVAGLGIDVVPSQDTEFANPWFLTG